MQALLIIDMQKGSFIPETPRHDSQYVIQRINQLSDLFRNNNKPVIFIQHDGSNQNCFIPGSDEWEILPSLIQDTDDLIISKTANDAFYKTKLQQVLENIGVTELVITGCATDFCVDTTVRSGLALDFNITVISDGHTTANRPHLDAKTVIKHHNWIWQEMTPTKGKVKVIPFKIFFTTEF